MRGLRRWGPPPLCVGEVSRTANQRTRQSRQSRQRRYTKKFSTKQKKNSHTFHNQRQEGSLRVRFFCILWGAEKGNDHRNLTIRHLKKLKLIHDLTQAAEDAFNRMGRAARKDEAEVAETIRRAVRTASMATFPPPTTATLSPRETWFPRLTSRR